MTIAYVFYSRVEKIERRKQVTRTEIIDRSKPASADNVRVTEIDLGWFVHLEGSREAVCIGPDEPAINVGDLMKVSMMVVQESSVPKS